MAETFTRIFVHVILSTQNRSESLTPDLFPYLGEIVRDCKGEPLMVNGTLDHVHMLLAMPMGMSLSELMRLVKTNSSRWMHEQDHESFEWQTGYAAFSVSTSKVEEVRRYIETQPDHHRRISPQDEFRTFLARNGAESIEQYV